MGRVDAEQQVLAAGSGGRPVRRGLQIVLALSVSAGLCLLVWAAAPDRLQAPLDIVGYSTFHDFNHNPRFLAYRLSVWVFPLLSAALYWALRRWWPGSPRTRGATRTPLPRADEHAAAEQRAGASRSRILHLAAALPAALVVAVAASSAGTSPDAHVSVRGLLIGVCYLALVALLAVLAGRLLRPGRTRVETPGSAISLVNAVASSVAAVVAVWYFSRHTAAITVGGSLHKWPWWPAWVLVLVLLGVLGFMVWRLVRGASPESLERTAVGAVVGSAAVWLLTASLPGPPGRLVGFDDMMAVTGADLSTRGYYPWRDFTFIHGFFEDSLRSLLGFRLFEHTLWGANAVGAAVWTPLGWVGLYLLAVCVAPRRWPAQVVVLMLIVAVSQTIPLPVRWVMAAPVFALACAVFRTRQLRWTALMTVALFVEAVLVPEASFQVLAIALVLVISDLAHRPAGMPRWRALRTTRDFVLVGAACSVLWIVYLAANGALGSFLDYYRIFGPGHAASGSLPFGVNSQPRNEIAYGLSIILVAITIAIAVVRGFRKDAVSPQHWLLLACGIFAGLYVEKGLARADDAHLLQSIAMALPLAIVWLMVLISAAMDAWSRWESPGRTRSDGPPVTRLGLTATSVALVAVLSVVLITLPSALRHAWESPGHNKALVAGTSTPLLGYTTPGSVDPTLVSDLRKVITTLAGRDGSVFDFTNSPGYVYYLLQQRSPTAFYHVSMAVPAFAQQLVVDQLRQRRPAVVTFDTSSIGLPTWDGVRNEVRHYEVSQYLLDGWTPVVRSHTMIVMVRNDLVPSLPTLPKLQEDPQTTNLYDAAPACDWGFVPDFLTSSPAGDTLSLDRSSRRREDSVDLVGWAFDAVARKPVRQVLVAMGDQVLRSLPRDEYRPDVEQVLGRDAATSGFRGTVLKPGPGTSDVYAVLSDGRAHPLTAVGNVPSRLQLPGGRSLPTSAVPARGHVDSETISRRWVSTFDVPDSVDLRTFRLASFSARGGLGRSDLILTDSVSRARGQDSTIAFMTRGESDAPVRVRVGSCLQWHGYTSRQLHVLQSGGRPVDAVRLSGVS